MAIRPAATRNQRPRAVLAIVPAMLLGASLVFASGAMAADTAKTFYLRNSGPTAFNLTLSETAGTATTETNTTTVKTFIDRSISNANTAFAVVGTWALAGLLPNQAITDLGSASLWVGNSNY